MAHRSIVEEYLNRTNGCGLYLRYPDISDRKGWETLSDELKKNLVDAGLEAQKEPWSQLLISDFREFSKSGNRVRFEDKYFQRRRKLNRLVLAECVQNEGSFLDDILDGLYLMLDETTWCLPAHNSYIRDKKQDTMPDVTRPIIDLFDAESGAEVAFTEYLLRPVFERISPFVSTYVNERLKERIFTPYLEQHFWWMGNGKEPMCNWTVWCTQNVLLCALTRPDGFFDEKVRRKFLEKAAVSCDYFLDEYGEDGGCDEGAQYYTHAGLCLFGCLEIMDGALGRKSGFSDIFSESLIRNVANYIVKMYVGNGYYINFADCSAMPGRRSAREFLFGRATGDEVLAGFAAADFKSENKSEQLLDDEINLFYHVMQAFSYDEMINYKESKALAEDTFFESVGLMVARDRTYTLAAKAGDNADSHNHNDVGSFTVYKEGKPFIIDLGVETYTQRTFSDRRYEIWTMQSQFHNLPTFFDDEYAGDLEKSSFGMDSAADYRDGRIIMQHDGGKYAASEVKCMLCQNSAEGISSLSMDIAGAYGDERIRSYKRTVSLIKGDCITVEDAYAGDLNAVVSLMTYEYPVVSLQRGGAGETESDRTSALNTDADDNKAAVINVGDLGQIEVEAGEIVKVQEFPIEDERLRLAWKHEVYRILIRPYEGKFTITLR